MQRESRVSLLQVLALLVATTAVGLWLAPRNPGINGKVAPRREVLSPDRPSGFSDSLSADLDVGSDDQSRIAVGSPPRTTEEQLSSLEGLQVFSLHGLPIHHVELFGADAQWLEVSDIDGRIDLSRASNVTMVRAAGHLARQVESMMGRIGLEPDSLLEVESPSLREAASVGPVGTAWGAEGSQILRECSTSAFVGPNRWAIAISSEEFLRQIPSNSLAIDIDHRLGVRFHADFSVQNRQVAKWILPVVSVQEVEHALLVYLSGDDLGMDSELRLLVDRLGTEEAHDVARYNWGNTFWTYRRFHQNLVVGSSEVEVRGCLLGAQYQLRCEDNHGNTLGLLRFFHTGVPRTLDILRSVEVHLRVVDSQGHPINEPCSVSVSPMVDSKMKVEDQAAVVWEAIKRRLELDAEGNGLMVIPPRISLATGEHAPVPSQTVLDLHAPFYKRQQMKVDLSRAARIDLGTIVLQSTSPDIVLLGDPHLDPINMASTSLRVADATPSRSFMVEAARRKIGGELELYLMRSDGDPPVVSRWGGDLSAASLLTPAPPALLVHPRSGFSSLTVPFEHIDSNKYLRVPTISHTIRYVVKDRILPGTWITVGWRWRGFMTVESCSQFAADGAQQTLLIRAPSEGVELWWRFSMMRNPPADAPLQPAGTTPLPQAGEVLELG